MKIPKDMGRPLMLTALLLLIPAVWATLYLLTIAQPQSSVPTVNVQPFSGDLEAAESSPPQLTYPQETLFVDERRSLYRDGGLRLVVPRMALDCPVVNGTQPEALEKGPGLYEYAQLPSRGNPNVSIAGHRDVFGSPFLKIDTLQQGDSLYLVYEENVYRYLWQKTDTVPPDDWSVIHCTGSALVTLTSCDPIGTTLNRIVAVGTLDSIEPYTEQYQFR